MEADTWSFAFSSSRRSYQSTLKSQLDLCFDFEEIEEDDELKTEYPCPYCSEDFDLLRLGYHIDEEHHLEADYGVCPVCALRVWINMADHITTEHGNIFKSKLKFPKGNIYSTLTSLRKEVHDAHYQSLLASQSSFSSSKAAPDPLLSFLSCAPPADSSESVQSASSTEVTSEEKSSYERMLEKDVHPSPLSDKEHVEKAKRCGFVQGLFLSAIVDGGL